MRKPTKGPRGDHAPESVWEYEYFMIRTISWITFLSMPLALPAHGQDAGQGPRPGGPGPSWPSLDRAVQKEAASWTTITSSPTGVQLVVDVIAAQNTKRWVLSASLQGRRQELGADPHKKTASGT